MGKGVERAILNLGIGVAFGAAVYFITVYLRERKNRLESSALFSGNDIGCCQNEQPLSCSDNTGACCGEEAPGAKQSADASGGGCGTAGSCCGGSSVPKTVKKGKARQAPREKLVQKVVFLYASRNGAAEKLTDDVKQYLSAFNKGLEMVKVDAQNMTIQQVEEAFCDKGRNSLFVFICSSYPDDEFVDNLKSFFSESASDWRFSKSELKKCAGMIPIILGDSTFGDDVYCEPARTIARQFSLLGGLRTNHFEIDNLKEKPETYFKEICQLIDETIGNGCVEEPVDEGADTGSSDEEAVDSADDDLELPGNSCKSGNVPDLEDIANVVRPTSSQVRPNRTRVAKEMLSDKLRGALSKQGYHLVGSHSGVKICRWTKAQLRGRGGCYKHSFYGIESHRCMEATPSLACANKCVFCWRHHTNPVGTSWRWVTDEPKMLVDGMIAGHRGMVKQLRGVPGVTSEKMVEAMNPVHCALSLVGEPIMYPRIAEFLDYLHSHGLSSYLVTNAQFPDEIKGLPPVTQFYTSIDASTQAELKAIDRPLHKDFWERFQQSLNNMKDICGRTVYRLTLVGGFNFFDAENYADLVKLGEPDFIEVKGVTYCGTSNNAELTMKNVPWHEEVVDFCEQMCSHLPEYSISCEHEHSNCVLISNHKYKTETGWNTWIDYHRFQQLYDEWKENGTKFTGVDYSRETPAWAVYGSEERGFDPSMKRHYRNKKAKAMAGEGS